MSFLQDLRDAASLDPARRAAEKQRRSVRAERIKSPFASRSVEEDHEDLGNPVASCYGAMCFERGVTYNGQTRRFADGPVSASVEETGGVAARSTLARSAVPGMHGWQKKVDNRAAHIVVEGPDFYWAISPRFIDGGEGGAKHLRGVARQFAAAVNNAARQGRSSAAGIG